MSNKILLNFPNAVFEPFIIADKGLPFHYGTFTNCTYIGPCTCNFHEHLELIQLLSGEAHIVYDNKTFVLTPGDVVVVNAYSTHQFVLDKAVGYCSLGIDSDFCKSNNIDINNVYFTEVIQDEQLRSRIRQFLEEAHAQNPFRTAALRLAALEILLYLCRNHSSSRTIQPLMNDSAWKYINSAITYIKENIDQPLPLEGVAASVGVSKYHFLREFKRITGYTLTSYINIIRCEHAKNLLQTGRYKIKEVALLCGFENESYFSNVFRKYTGTLPSEFVRSAIVIN